MVTKRPVDISAAAAKSLAHQVTVKRGVNLGIRAHDLRARNAAINVATRISRRGVILGLILGQCWTVCHALAGFNSTISFQYTGSKSHTGALCPTRLLTLATNTFLEISRAPSNARCRVFCWQ